MKSFTIAVIGCAAFAAVVAGQQVQPPSTGPENAAVCATAQLRALRVLDAIDTRVELARQTNSASDLRAAVADVQRGLLEARTELGRCVSPAPTSGAAPADPHAGHGQPR
jgi:hypothetical protein